MRNLRNSLRSVVIHGIHQKVIEYSKKSEEFRKTGDIKKAYSYSNIIAILLNILRKSICQCLYCEVENEDMIYIHAIDPMDQGWYCINCYKNYAYDFDKYVITPERGLIPYQIVLREKKFFMRPLKTVGFFKKGKEYPMRPPKKI